MEQSTRPPRGIVPRFLWEEQRLTDIQGAIHRYTLADRPIPNEWLSEFKELFEKKLERLKAPTYNFPNWDEIEREAKEIREAHYWETIGKLGNTEDVSRNAESLQPLRESFRRNSNSDI